MSARWAKKRYLLLAMLSPAKASLRFSGRTSVQPLPNKKILGSKAAGRIEASACFHSGGQLTESGGALELGTGAHLPGEDGAGACGTMGKVSSGQRIEAPSDW